jgi:hypothetical protein
MSAAVILLVIAIVCVCCFAFFLVNGPSSRLIVPEPDDRATGCFGAWLAFVNWQRRTMTQAAVASEILGTGTPPTPVRRASIVSDVDSERRHMNKRVIAHHDFDIDREAVLVDETFRWCAVRMGFLPVRN